MIATTNSIMMNIDRGPFFATHLSRCLDECNALADRTARHQEIRQLAEKWFKMLSKRLQEEIQLWRVSDGRLTLTDDRMKIVGYKSRALFALACCFNSSDAGQILCQWAELLTECAHISDLFHTLSKEVNLLLAETAKGLSPDLSCADLQRSLSATVASLENAHFDNDALRVKSEELCDQVKATIDLLAQHERHQTLVGSKLFLDVLGDENNKEEPAYVLVHLFNPFSKSLHSGVRGIQQASLGPSGKSAFKPSFIAIQSGLAFHPSGQRLIQSVGQTADDEAQALSQAKRFLGLPGDVRLLRNETKEFQLLRPKFFPVNILLDPLGNVVSVLTGPEPEKVRRLLHLVKSDKPAQAVR
jgi:hypothetical protein